MRNSLKMDVLDELRSFREKRLSNSTFCTAVSYSNLNMNLESETVERIVTKNYLLKAYHKNEILCDKIIVM